jgi:branched-chain amino acid transport system substrate-binding protein
MKTFRVFGFLLLLFIAVAGRPTYAQDKPKIKVGFLGAFTGPDPNTANELLRGATVFLSLNISASKQLEIVKLDTEGSISSTVKVMEAAASDGIRFFVGISSSDEAIAAAKVAEEKGLIFITPFATNLNVTKGKKNTFRACFDDDQQGRGLANFARELVEPAKTVVLTNRVSSYSTGLSDTFIKTYAGKSAPNQIFYSGDRLDSEVHALVEIVLKARPALVFAPDHITRAAILAKHIHAKLPSVRFLGGDGFGGKKMFLRVMGPESQIFLNYSTHWTPDSGGTKALRFQKSYRRLYVESEPTSGAALTYDAMSILFAGIDSARDSSIEAVREAIEKYPIVTLAGKITFGKERHSPDRPIVMIELKDGRYRTLGRRHE